MAASYLLALLLALPAITLAGEEITLLANTSPPYADRTLPEEGLALELVKHVYSRTDYQPKITIENWSRAMEGVRIGVYDALAAAWYTDERNEAFLFSEPYLESDLLIVTLRTDRRPYSKLAHLSGRRLGVRTDYAYGIDFDAIPDLTLVEENHLIQSLLNLLNGKVDFVIGDRRTMVMQMQEYLGQQATKFRVVPMDLPGRARHIAASRDVEGHESIIAAFNRALAETRKDGSYDAILDRWEALYGSMD
ncbi:MAG: transporter substrate-binding domain-containing protein [Pseudomonadota bacterium]